MRARIARTWIFKISVHAMLWLFLISAVAHASAQNARLELKNLDKLSDKASEVNDITLDGSLLDLAWKFLEASHDPDAAQLKDALKGLKGIYVKNFEFDEPNQYSQEDVQAIRVQLTGPGWSRIVESHSKRSKEHDEIYILKQGDAVAGMAILVAEPKELTVVNIVGPIDINKLGELEGHFGIPGEEGRHHERKSRPGETKPPSDKPSTPKGDDDAED
jgi:hypothetical protein